MSQQCVLCAHLPSLAEQVTAQALGQSTDSAIGYGTIAGGQNGFYNILTPVRENIFFPSSLIFSLNEQNNCKSVLPFSQFH